MNNRSPWSPIIIGALCGIIISHMLAEHIMPPTNDLDFFRNNPEVQDINEFHMDIETVFFELDDINYKSRENIFDGEARMIVLQLDEGATLTVRLKDGKLVTSVLCTPRGVLYNLIENRDLG